MPDRTFNDDDVQAGDLPGLMARAASLAQRMQNISDHLGKLANVVPGPPSDQGLVASLNSIVALAATITQTTQTWLGRPVQQPPR